MVIEVSLLSSAGAMQLAFVSSGLTSETDWESRKEIQRSGKAFLIRESAPETCSCFACRGMVDRPS